MATADLISQIAVVTIEYLVGVALNMDILLVYVAELKKGLSIGPSDKVHLTKALVNLSLYILTIRQCILFAFWPHLFFTNDTFHWIIMITTSLISYSYWLMALLCVYYCTNITNCGHHIFVWLKRSLSSYLNRILLASGLGSLAIMLPIFWFCSINLSMNSTDQVIQGTFLENIPYKKTLATMGFYLPFAVSFFSTAFTSWSLINHMWTMKQNNPGFTRCKFQTQINATRTMILFLLITVIYNVVLIFFNSMLTSISSDVVIMTWFVIMSYPIPEAIIIIQSSSKLKKSLLGKFLARKRRISEAENKI